MSEMAVAKRDIPASVAIDATIESVVLSLSMKVSSRLGLRPAQTFPLDSLLLLCNIGNAEAMNSADVYRTAASALTPGAAVNVNWVTPVPSAFITNMFSFSLVTGRFAVKYIS